MRLQQRHRYHPAGRFRVPFRENVLIGIYPEFGSAFRTPQGIGEGTRVSELEKVPGTRTQVPGTDGSGMQVTIPTGTIGYSFNVVDGQVENWFVGTDQALDFPEGCI